MKRNQFNKDIKLSVKVFQQFNLAKMSKVEREEFERELTNLRNLYLNNCNDMWKRWAAYYL